MRAVSAALRAAIDAGERIIDSTFTVDWDNDGDAQDIDNLSRKASSVALNQSLESSLPPQVQLVPGVAVAELTAELARGNTNRYTVPATYRSLTTSGVGGGSTPTWVIARPTTTKEGDIVLVTIFATIQGFGSVLSGWQPLIKSNVTWLPMAVRGDGGSGGTRLEGLLLYRRASANEPANYTITLPIGSTVVYASAAVNVGEQNLMGVSDFAQKGEDSTDIPTGITLPQVKVDVPGSTIISFFGAASYAVSGIGFTPLDVNDVEQTEFVVVATGSLKPSIRAAVTTHSNAAQGLYQKGVVFTGSSGTQTIATIGFSIVLAPKIAGDEVQHAAWTFSELNRNSPYAGKTRIRRKTRWALNFVTPAGGFESVPMFTGYTSAPSASSDRTATIKALDNRETMRNTGQGLNIAAVYPVNIDTITGSNLPAMPGLESTWIVSRSFFFAFWRVRQQLLGIFTYESQYPVVTKLGYFPSPLSNQYAGIWATFHGSAHEMLAANAQLAYAYTEGTFGGGRRRIAYEVGPFVAATKNESVGTNTFIGWQHGNWVPWNATVGQIIGRLQCWIRRNQATSYLKVDFNDANVPVLWDAWIEILTTGVVQFRVEKPSVSRTIVGPTITVDGLWHFLGVHYDSVAGSVVFRVDNTSTTVAMSTWANAAISFIVNNAQVTLKDGMQIAEFQSCGGYSVNGQATGIPLSDPWANENFTPTAFVDKSENLLDVFPFVDPNVDTFGVVSDIASAEFAAFFFDADGYPHFRNSRSDASTTGQTVQKSITSRKSIKDISYESGVLQIRNIISVGYTPYGATINGQIFSLSGIIGLQPNTSQTYNVVLQGPMITFNAPTYTAFSQPDGTGTNLTSKVNVNLVLNTAGVIGITITNTASSTAYLVNSSGQANFVITGTFFAPLQGNFSPIVYSDSDSIREFNEQTLDVGNQSVWVQREDSAASLALKLLSDLCQPRPVITRLQIKGDPTLEFGDLVTVSDPNGLGVNGQYRITVKDPTMNVGGGFTQSLVVRGAPAIAFWDTNFWDDGTVWG